MAQVASGKMVGHWGEQGIAAEQGRDPASSARCSDFLRRSFRLGVNELTVLDDDDAAGTSGHFSHLDGSATLSLSGFLGPVHGFLAR